MVPIMSAVNLAEVEVMSDTLTELIARAVSAAVLVVNDLTSP